MEVSSAREMSPALEAASMQPSGGVQGASDRALQAITPAGTVITSVTPPTSGRRSRKSPRWFDPEAEAARPQWADQKRVNSGPTGTPPELTHPLSPTQFGSGEDSR